VTAGLAFWERWRKVSVSLRTYFVVFVIFALPWSCFLAWQDEHRNTQQVIDQKSAAFSQLNLCVQDRRVENAYKLGLEGQLLNQRQTIDSEATSVSKQQEAINSCVVSLGKMNPIINRKVTALALQYGPQQVTDNSGRKVYVFAIVVLTKSRLEPKGSLRCEHDFDLATTPDLASGKEVNVSINTKPRSVRVSSREYSIAINSASIYWDSEHPIYVTAVSVDDTLGDCSFTPQP